MINQYRTIKIVIADDHAIFRDGFKVLLKNQEELELIGEANDGKELIELTERVQPDVVISDIMMPEMDGIAACKIIKAQFPEVKVIALTMFNDDNLVVEMLEAGAKGYLLKNTNKNELLLATKTVHDGGTYYCSATSMKLSRLIAESRFTPNRPQPAARFTSRETDIIKLVCEQYTNKEIATKLGLSIRTVESHREKIQEKTGSKNSIGVVVYAIKHKLYVP